MIHVLALQAVFVTGSFDVGLAGLGGVDVDSVVLSLHLEADLLTLILAGESGDLGRVQRHDVAGNHLGLLNGEVHIVDAQLVVEPMNLLVDQRLGNPGSLEDDGLD